MSKTENAIAAEIKIKLMQNIKLLAEDIRLEFNKNDIVKDNKEIVAKQISQNICRTLQYDFEVIWKEYNIHRKIATLKNVLQENSIPSSMKLWRPKNCDTNQQLKSIIMQKKLEYKRFLESEIAQKRKCLGNLRNSVSQQRLNFNNVQNCKQRLHLKNQNLLNKLDKDKV